MMLLMVTMLPNDVTHGNGNHVTHGNGIHVTHGNGNHVTHGNGNHVTHGNGNHVTHGNGNRYPSPLTHDGDGIHLPFIMMVMVSMLPNDVTHGIHVT